MAAAAAEAKRKLSSLSREELLERCAELEVQNARLGLRLAAAERDDVRRDGSASSDSEDEGDDDDEMQKSTKHQDASSANVVAALLPTFRPRGELMWV